MPLDIETSAIQGDFLLSPADAKLFSGGKGSGKSYALILQFLMYVGAGFGDSWNGVILSKRSKGLRNLEIECAKICRNCFPNVYHTRNKFQFSTGETLNLLHANDETSFMQSIHGSSFSFAGIDEAAIWSDSNVFMQLFTTLRTASRPKGKILPTCIALTANPAICTGQASGHWLYAMFIQNKKEKILYENNGVNYAYFHTNIMDNMHILESAPQYKNILENIPCPKLRASYLKGVWQDADDLPFSKCWDEKYCVVKPFEIPPSWHVDIGYDFGYSKPSAIIWFAESDGSPYIDHNGQWIQTNEGDLFAIEEYYTASAPNKGLGLSAKEIAMGFDKKNKWHVTTGVADKAIFGEMHDNTYTLPFEQLGVHLRPSKSHANTCVPSLSKLQQMLFNTQTTDSPFLKIFSNCVNVIRTVPNLPWETNKAKAYYDTSAEDHCADVLRYRIMEMRQNVPVMGAFSH